MPYVLRFTFYIFILLLSACSLQQNASPPPPIETTQIQTQTGPIEDGSASVDLLATIQERGYIKVGVRVWPEARFKPPLFREPWGGLNGYEVDLAWLIADSLGVGLEMAESDPRRLGIGDWQNEWDIALAWLPITDQSQQNLIFSNPYAYDTGTLLTHQSSQVSNFGALGGQSVAVPANTIYADILTSQTPTIAGKPIVNQTPPYVTPILYLHDGKAIYALNANPETPPAAVFHTQTVSQAATETDLVVKVVAKNIFQVPVGVAFDRQGLPSERLRIEINTLLNLLHQSGEMAELSLEWYDQDITHPTPNINSE